MHINNMANTTKIINIDTSKAQKGISDLKSEVQDLQQDVTKLNGSNFDEFGKSAGSAIKSVNTQIEALNTSIDASKEMIDTLAPSVAKVGAAVSGGFNIVTTAMSLFGTQTDESSKAITQLQFYLQNLPFQFFAIAEGITAASNGISTLSKLFSKIDVSKVFNTFGVQLTNGKQTFDGIRATVVDIYSDVVDIGAIFKSTSKEWLEIQDFLKKNVENLYKQYDDVYEVVQKINSFPKRMNVEQAEELQNLNQILKKLEEKYGIDKQIADLNEEYNAKLDGLYQKNATEIGKIIKQTKLLHGGIVAVVAVLGLIAASKAKEYLDQMSESAQKFYNDLKEFYGVGVTGLQDAQKQITQIEALTRVAKDETRALTDRKQAIEELNRIVPGYNASLNASKGLYVENTTAINNYITELKRQAIAIAAVNVITSKYQTIIEKQSELKIAEQLQALQEEYDLAYRTTGISVELRERYDSIMDKSNKKILKNIDNLKKEIADEYADIENIYSSYDTFIRPTKQSGSGSAAAETIKKEFIARLKPSEQDMLEISDAWIGKVPLIETAKRLAQQVSNVIDIVNEDDSITSKQINIKVGDLITDEVKQKWQEYFDYMTEAQHQMQALNDMAQRLGESSLGLTGSWQNVIGDFSNMFAQLGNNIQSTITEGEIGFDSWTKMAATGVAAIGTLLNALSDEQDSTSKEGFEAQKKYQIGATVMNTLAGVINAWSSALAITPPVGPILGAANSAMMIALGAVQIAKIKKQTFGGSSDVSGSAVANTITTPTQISNAVQNANIEAAVTDSKVYVVESDIQAVGNKVNVQETENRY